MKDLTFITGNPHKAHYTAKWLGMPLQHHKLDLEEPQSLDLREVSEHKARQAYQLLHKPVLVEDVALTFTAMGKLPGTLIRWFLEELQPEGLCKLVDGFADRTARAEILYVLYDGTTLQHFHASKEGTVAPKPRGEGFGWNPVFIPEGSTKTYAEMSEEEFEIHSHRAAAVRKLANYLKKNSASQQ